MGVERGEREVREAKGEVEKLVGRCRELEGKLEEKGRAVSGLEADVVVLKGQGASGVDDSVKVGWGG